MLIDTKYEIGQRLWINSYDVPSQKEVRDICIQVDSDSKVGIIYTLGDIIGPTQRTYRLEEYRGGIIPSYINVSNACYFAYVFPSKCSCEVAIKLTNYDNAKQRLKSLQQGIEECQDIIDNYEKYMEGKTDKI